MRVGQGYDVHQLISKEEFLERFPDRGEPKFIMGGIEIPHDKFLAGHSDADVLIHAIIDALLGAAGLNDIGTHFPDTDERYAGISSLELLKETSLLLKKKGLKIINVDSTVIAEKPKLREHIANMQKVLSEALSISHSQLNIKATTTEKLGFTGRQEGIASQAICLLG